MPGIMSQMPPLLVSLNDDLANSLLPNATQVSSCFHNSIWVGAWVWRVSSYTVKTGRACYIFSTVVWSGIACPSGFSLTMLPTTTRMAIVYSTSCSICSTFVANG